MSILFSHNGSNWGVDYGPNYTYPLTKKKPQFLEYASDASPFIYNKSPLSTITHSFHFNGMTTSDLDALEAFFYDVVDGTRETFTWTDGLGAVRTDVRFTSKKIESKEDKPGFHIVDFSVEQQI